jgi:methyl-accepting chemotaxis protein
MSNEEIERAIEFILSHHAKVSADIERHSEQIGQLTENIERHSEQIGQLTESVQAMRVEMRDAINNLIVANEVTRKLTEDVARLAINNSQRITAIEQQSS